MEILIYDVGLWIAYRAVALMRFVNDTGSNPAPWLRLLPC